MNRRKMYATGPRNCKIMIVGEAPGVQEERKGVPFVGQAGKELTTMLKQAGVDRKDCFLTNVCKYRPKNNDIKNLFIKYTDTFKIPGPLLEEGIKELETDIKSIRPNIIIALGAEALWVLCGETGISKWRGSILPCKFYSCKVLPTYHPTIVLKVWSWKFTVVQDLKRAKKESQSPEIKDPKYLFHIKPTYLQAKEFLLDIINDLDKGPMKISSDIETLARNISCHGIGISKREAMCIPFMTKDNPQGFFLPDEEFHIIQLQRYILQHHNARVVGQGYSYDVQYLMRDWLVKPNISMDTMLAWHTLYPGDRKSLDYLASLLCESYVYWKDELKNYHSYPVNEELYWTYNCKDCVYTYEVSDNLESLITLSKMQEPYNFQMSMFYPILKMMIRGTKIDLDKKRRYYRELSDAIKDQEKWFEKIIPLESGSKKSPWYRSSKQLNFLLYEELKLPVQFNKKTKKPTTDEAALGVLAKKEPALKTLLLKLQEYRSLGVFLDNFVKTRLCDDNRMRCSFDLAGTKTFRLSSSSSAFGTGTNLQNIPSGNKTK